MNYELKKLNRKGRKVFRKGRKVINVLLNQL